MLGGLVEKLECSCDHDIKTSADPSNVTYRKVCSYCLLAGNSKNKLKYVQYLKSNYGPLLDDKSNSKNSIEQFDKNNINYEAYAKRKQSSNDSKNHPLIITTSNIKSINLLILDLRLYDADCTNELRQGFLPYTITVSQEDLYSENVRQVLNIK